MNSKVSEIVWLVIAIVCFLVFSFIFAVKKGADNQDALIMLAAGIYAVWTYLQRRKRRFNSEKK